MKYASRIQPFLAVTRKEADAMEMEDRLQNILKDETLSSRLKSRLLEDGIAKLKNYKEERSLSPDILSQPSATKAEKAAEQTKHDEEARPTTTVTVKKSRKSQKKKSEDSFKKSDKARKQIITKSSKKKKGPVLQVKTPPPAVSIPRESTHNRRDSLGLSNLPSFMKTTANSRNKQKGTGSDRLYIRKWK